MLSSSVRRSEAIDRCSDRNDQHRGVALVGALREYNLPLQDKGMDLNATRLEGLSETWMKALENRRQLEARYSAALQANSRGDAINIPDIADSKIFQDAVRINRERRAKLQDDIRTLEKQIQELRAQKEANSPKWTEEHPEMRKLNAQIGMPNITSKR